MTTRKFSDTIQISDTATPGEIVYTAPTVGGALARISVYATNIDGAATRTITVQHEKGTAHSTQELLNIVDAYPVVHLAKQELVCLALLRGHKTDPDDLKIWGEVADDIIVVLDIEVAQ